MMFNLRQAVGDTVINSRPVRSDGPVFTDTIDWIAFQLNLIWPVSKMAEFTV